MGSVTEWKVVVGLSYEDACSMLEVAEDFYGDVHEFMEEILFNHDSDNYTTLNYGYDSEVEVFGIDLKSAEMYSVEVNLLTLAYEAQKLQKALNKKFGTDLFKVYIGTNTY